ncbi:MAG: hypothetical protein ACTS4T_00120 [Candidatus Hodgkinia cicadicola]
MAETSLEIRLVAKSLPHVMLINVGWNFRDITSLINRLKLQTSFGGKTSNEKLMRARDVQ